MNFLKLELSLLNYWKSQGVKWLYKYKHRVKEYQGENLSNIELFTDITSGLMFRELLDIANFNGVTGEDVKINIDKLIAIRQEDENFAKDTERILNEMQELVEKMK